MALAGIECGASDDAEGDGADGRHEDAGCAANEYLSADNWPKDWKEGDQHNTDCQCDDGYRDQYSLGPQ